MTQNKAGTTIRERFPAPWHVVAQEFDDDVFCVRAANGADVAFVYSTHGKTGMPDHPISRAEALAIAKAIARLPDLASK